MGKKRKKKGRKKEEKKGKKKEKEGRKKKEEKKKKEKRKKKGKKKLQVRKESPFALLGPPPHAYSVKNSQTPWAAGPFRSHRAELPQGQP